MSAQYQNLIVAREKAIGLITLNRPEVYNALNQRALSELKAAFIELGEDKDVRVIVITGAGDKAFCSGGDLKESKGRDLMAQIKFLRDFLDLGLQMEENPKPIIAAVDGFALGGGVELMLPCDFVIATKRSTFGLPEINHGVIPGAGGPARLPRIVGKSIAKELMFTGKRITADEAKQIGLILKVVDTREDLVKAYTEMADELARKAPLAIMQIKRLVNKSFELPTERALDFAHEAGTLVDISEDRQEGLKAFAEKREAKFKGK